MHPPAGVGIFDEFGKDVLELLLADRGGEVRLEHPVRTRAQAIDLWFTPSPEPGGSDPLLSRMTVEPCAFELVSRAPDVDVLLSNARKVLNLAHQRSLESRPRSLRRHLSPMWVLAAGTPTRALRELRARPMSGYPRGFFVVLEPLPLRVVAIRALPESPETRWLRLLGRGKTLDRALAEVRRSKHDPRSRLLLPAVGQWLLEMSSSHEELGPEEEAFAMRVRKTYEELMSEVQTEVYLEVVRDQLEARFGPLDEPAEHRLSRASLTDLRAWARRLLTASSLEEVLGSA